MNNVNRQEILEAAALTHDGLLEIYNGNYELAITLFNQALKIVPKLLGALQGRALCKTLLLTTVPV